MNKLALLVGISEYKSALEPLPSAEQDVLAMQQVLENEEMGGFREVIPLVNPPVQDLRRAIYDLFAERNQDDLLLFYFSGHGVKDQHRNLYLTTPETEKNQRGSVVTPTAIAANYLQSQISASRSERIVIILDCCFSGAFAKGMTAKDDGEVDIFGELGGKGRAILTSSSSTQYSFEQDDSQLSIYSRYLIEGIKTGAADRDNDGRISVEELHNYAKEKVQQASPAMTPQFYPVEEGYKIYLARSPQDDPQLKYRQEAQKRIRKGNFSRVGLRILRQLRTDLGLSTEEAEKIEADVLQPYRQYEQKLKEFTEAVEEVIEDEGGISPETLEELQDYQKLLSLVNEDVEPIMAQYLVKFKPKPEPQAHSPAKPQPKSSVSEKEAEVELKSAKGIDYTKLRDLLAGGEWREADEETARVMLKVADREEEGWLDSDSIKIFPCEDLRTIDQLWVKYSQGHFGFSVQKQIYQEVQEDYGKFGDRVGWRVKETWIYYSDTTFGLDAPMGHLPGEWNPKWQAGIKSKRVFFSRAQTCRL